MARLSIVGGTVQRILAGSRDELAQALRCAGVEDEDVQRVAGSAALTAEGVLSELVERGALARIVGALRPRETVRAALHSCVRASYYTARALSGRKAQAQAGHAAHLDAAHHACMQLGVAAMAQWVDEQPRRTCALTCWETMRSAAHVAGYASAQNAEIRIQFDDLMAIAYPARSNEAQELVSKHSAQELAHSLDDGCGNPVSPAQSITRGDGLTVYQLSDRSVIALDGSDAYAYAKSSALELELSALLER